MKEQSHPARMVLIGYLCMGIGILILVVMLARGESKDSDSIPFYISGSGESTTAVVSDIVTIQYQMELSNSGKHNEMIHTIEPILHDKAQEALWDKTRPIFVVEQKLGKNDIRIAGEIKIDMIKLGDNDTVKHMPFIDEYKITYDNAQVARILVKNGQVGRE